MVLTGAWNLEQETAGTTVFHHGACPEPRRRNGLGSTDRLTDTNQDVDTTYLYRAFGEQSVLSGSHANPFGWVGRLGYYRQSDQDTYWLRARTYSQLTGRFLSRDPMPNGNQPNNRLTSLYLYPTISPSCWWTPAGWWGVWVRGVARHSGRNRPAR